MHGSGSRKVNMLWFAALLLAVFMAGFGESRAAEGDQVTTEPPGQTQGTGQMRRAIPGVKLKKTEEKLSLNAEQREKMQVLVDKELEQIKALRQDRSLTKEQKREKFSQLREATHDKIKEILTPEQQKKFAEHFVNERKFRENMRQIKSVKPQQ
jgi:periplasmic protein CpxP/Spy